MSFKIVSEYADIFNTNLMTRIIEFYNQKKGWKAYCPVVLKLS